MISQKPTQYQTKEFVIKPTLVDEGLLLAGANHEVRILLMGATALHDGELTVTGAHRFLKTHGYDELHEMQPTHLRTLAGTLPPELVDKELLASDDVLKLKPLGFVSAALGSTMLREFAVNGTGLVGLVGGYKRMRDNEQPPAPSVRRNMYSFLLEHPADGVSLGDFYEALTPYGVTQKAVRKHLEVLEDRGIATCDGPPLGVRKIEATAIPLIERYTQVVANFIEDPSGNAVDEGTEHIAGFFNPSSRDRATIPFLVKRAMNNSGSSDPVILHQMNDEIRDIFEVAGKNVTLTTSEIAERLGVETYIVTSYLNRIVRNLNGKASAKLVGRTKKNERVWQLRTIVEN